MKYQKLAVVMAHSMIRRINATLLYDGVKQFSDSQGDMRTAAQRCCMRMFRDIINDAYTKASLRDYLQTIREFYRSFFCYHYGKNLIKKQARPVGEARG